MENKITGARFDPASITTRRSFFSKTLLGYSGLFMTSATFASSKKITADNKEFPRPIIDSNWWPVAGNPDLGKYGSPKQEPVDFGVWQASDGTWQLWSCIRGSNFPGATIGKRFTNRFLYGWEGDSLTSTNWKPQGIKWVADPSLGETPGGIQAPYVFKEDNVYYLFYGDWKRICLAKSFDGKEFNRVLGGNGQPDLFAEEHLNFSHAINDSSRARDPMVLKRGNTYYCYYTSHLVDPVNSGWAFCRTSLDLKNWSESVVISRTPTYKGSDPKYSDECPQVVYLPEYKLYYLFVTQLYGEDCQTTVYASPNPMYFGVDDDSRKVCTLSIAAPEIIFHDGQYYLFCLNRGLDGIRAARLRFG